MKNITLRFAVTLVLCLLCVWALSAKSVRLGKDLRGGVSLIYSVRVPKDAKSDAVLTQVIEVLKDRVNPNGVLDIAMQPQGQDRIEVVMPLPSPEVRALQKAYKQALDEFMKGSRVGATELDQALAANKAPQTFGESGPRGDDLKALQNAFNEMTSAQAELDRARAAGAPPEAISETENRVVNAQIIIEHLRSKLLGQVLNQTRLVKALGLTTEPAADRDPKTNEIVRGPDGAPKMGPSLRDREINAIKSEFPHLAEGLDRLVEKHDAYVAKRTGLDDPEDLKRLLRGAGVLEFHIAVSPTAPVGVNIEDMRQQLAKRGPKNTEGAAHWYEINDLKQWYDSPQELDALQRDPVTYFGSRYRLVVSPYAGTYWALLHTGPVKSMVHGEGDDWSLTKVYRTNDQRLGALAVGFSLDQPGGSRMGRMTGAHVGQPMAIVLDEQVFSAPNLNSAISNSGIITGNFGEQEISYLIRVLAAGSLKASISADPISESVLGPSIGADNLAKGRSAILLSMAFTAILMIGYYFLAGLIADIGLAVHALMIFGVMAAIDGTFTLPGLAGIALSVAMAVDANVLIYERMREEMTWRGESLRNAVQLGYGRALPPIVDGNITNLIVAVVLYQFGATEVKGFALTMLIGIATALFASLYVTRAFFMALIEWFGLKKLAFLPTTFPIVSRILTPKINWISIRGALWTVCVVLCVGSIVLIAQRGKDIFATEFRGGVAMTLETRPAKPGEPAGPDGRLLLSRADVEARVRKVGETVGASNPILYELRNAGVLIVGEGGTNATSDAFQIRVGNPPSGVGEGTKLADTIVGAVVLEFANEMDVQLPLRFEGAGDSDHSKHTFLLEKDSLGDSIRQPEIREAVGDFRGGVAVVIKDIVPPTTAENVHDRINRMRTQPDFSDTAGRSTKVIGLTPADPSDPSKGFTSIAVLVADPTLSSVSSEFELWDKQLAQSEWKLVSGALLQKASLKEVSSFSPVVAENLAATALVAVLLSLFGMLFYIWARFGSFRYSAAAVTSLVFNVICCLGFLAAAPWLAHTALGRALYIEEFRIDLDVVAGLLAIIGYAINDTIVILDRIRENKGKLPFASLKCVNDSINQTFSRTVLTGGLTFATAITLIVLGGTGIRPFAYTFFIGLVAGTFSSVVVAAPMVYSRKDEEELRRKADLLPASAAAAVAPA